MTVMIQRLKAKLGTDADLKDLLTGSAVNFIFKILGVAFTFALSFLVARVYGAEGMGIFSLCVVVLQLTAMFAKSGMDHAAMKFTSQYAALGRMDIVKSINLKIFKFALMSGSLATLILYIAAPYLSEYAFDKPYLGQYFQLTAYFVIPFTFIFILAESLKGLRKIKAFAFLQECSHFIIATAVLVGLNYFYHNNFIPVISFFTGVTITLFIGIALWHRQTKILSYDASDEVNYKTITNFAIPIMVIFLMDALSRYVGTLMLGAFGTEADVGVFSVMDKISAVILLPLMTVNAIVIPKFSECFAKKDMVRMEKTALQAGQLILMLTLPAVLIVFFFPEFLLGLFGEEFKVGASAIIVLVAGKFIFAGTGLAGSILQMTENHRLMRNIIVFATILNIVLNYIFIPIYGVMGAAFSNAIAVSTWNLIVVFFVKKRLGIFAVYFPFAKTK